MFSMQVKFSAGDIFKQFYFFPTTLDLKFHKNCLLTISMRCSNLLSVRKNHEFVICRFCLRNAKGMYKYQSFNLITANKTETFLQIFF